ncbi:MAG: aminomethyltransferase beta-barrel domain-containing protein, partial [Elusimicrobiota bacterium]
IKFGLLLDKIKAMGFTYLATGHYAQVLSETVDGKVVYNLTRGVDEHKDQSYWLYELNQKTLPYILLPLGGFTKTGVRICAKNAGLPVAEKKESQEVCFVTGKKYAEFVVEWLTKNETKPVRVVPGDIINTSGKVLGKHKGILYYTIGQRQGLGVSAKKPLYVTKILVDKNMVVVGDETELYTSQVDVCNINWIVKHPVLLPLKCMAKIRYQHKLAGCVISTLENDSRKLRLKFDEPQRAVTPGQSAVFYSLDGNTVLGGGII